MDKNLLSVKAVKSFRNAPSKFGKHTSANNNKCQERNKDFEPLTTKNAVKFLLEGSLKYRVCRYCLNVVSYLAELDEIFEVARDGVIYKVTLRDMISCIHPFKVVNDPNFPDKICSKCVESAINSYKFSQQCERGERALRNCFEDIYEKFEKLDPIERTRKRGRQKANPNPNVLYTEHEKVIDYAEPIINIVNVGSTSIDNDTKISQFECPKCWQVLPDVESLLNHESLHPKHMWFSCRLCGKSFVKHHQYKKHIKDFHQWEENIPTSNNTSFSCEHCGVISDTLGQHFQHTEKHKFKTTFKHLINRTMDELCAVCLEKGSCMVHMNETVHLKGGYPGIHDEMSIYNIVTSTFPEQKSYKYQELLIPTKAHNMSITKKMDHGEGKDLTMIYNKDKNVFYFCHPTILSMVKLDCDTFHVFVLSEPHKLNNLGQYMDENDEFLSRTSNDTSKSPALLHIGTSEDDSEVAKMTDIDTRNVINYDLDEENNFVEKNWLPNSHSKNVYNSKYEDKFECKTCWIFNKAVCQKCLDETQNCPDEAKKEDVIETVAQKCSYCWLFMGVGKCNNCKKILKVDIVTNENRDDQNDKPTADIVDISKGGNNVIIEKENFDIEETDLRTNTSQNNTMQGNTRKRKSNLELHISPKMKWKCRICMTNNDRNRQTCFCCEFDASIFDNKVKFNFGTNKNPFEILDAKNEITATPHEVMEESVAVSKTDNTTSVSVAVSKTDYTESDTMLSTEFATSSLPSAALNIEKSVNAGVISTEYAKANLPSIPMDIETVVETQTDWLNGSKSNMFAKEELMEVCEDSVNNSNTPNNMAPFNGNLNIPVANINFTGGAVNMNESVPFQFTMGVSTSKTEAKTGNRRIMKSFRRIANKGIK